MFSHASFESPDIDDLWFESQWEMRIHWRQAEYGIGEYSTKLSEFFALAELFCPRQVPGKALSEFLSACHLCKSKLTEFFFAELTEFAPKLSEFSRNTIPPVS